MSAQWRLRKSFRHPGPMGRMGSMGRMGGSETDLFASEKGGQTPISGTASEISVSPHFSFRVLTHFRSVLPGLCRRFPIDLSETHRTISGG